eukprot:5000295-Prymnesium_polylepis.1
MGCGVKSVRSERNGYTRSTAMCNAATSRRPGCVRSSKSWTLDGASTPVLFARVAHPTASLRASASRSEAARRLSPGAPSAGSRLCRLYHGG